MICEWLNMVFSQESGSWWFTLPETKIAFENGWLKDEISFRDGKFICRGYVSFTKCIQIQWIGSIRSFTPACYRFLLAKLTRTLPETIGGIQDKYAD